MTKKTLAERFEVLEQEYNSVMSTKYMNRPGNPGD